MGRLQDEIDFRGKPKRRSLPLVSAHGGHGNRFTRHRFAPVPASPFRRQRVTVKVHYTKLHALKGAASLARHRRYIEREGVGLDGKKPELFSAEEDAQAESAEVLSPIDGVVPPSEAVVAGR